jgi:hypothetical protein
VNWSDLNLNEVNIERDATSTRSEVPAGNYKFRLAGSKPNPFKPGTTDIDLVIVEGEYKGRHVFATLPPPDAYSWVPQAAAILVKRLGITQMPGEDLVDTLSRGAANGAGLITADVIEDKFTDNAGNLRSKPKLQYFSIAAAV